MVFSPAISALHSSFGAGKALNAAHVKVREDEGVDADKLLDACKYSNAKAGYIKISDRILPLVMMA